MIPWSRYDLILFDFDDTLVDFSASESHAVASVCRRFGREPDDDLVALFRSINRAAWDEQEAGLLPRGAVFEVRFRRFLAAIGIEGDAATANQNFLAALAEHTVAYPGALSMLAFLAEHAVLGIVTNGHGATQRRRAHHTGIGALVRFLAISDEVGASKPERAIFEAAYSLSRLPPGRRVLMVGDSFAADVGGALAAGFDACWISHGRSAAADSIVPTYTASTLAEFHAWLQPPY